MSKKYELTNETMELIKEDGSKVTLYRIKALKDFGFINKGDLGGWVESEENLSQEEECWIHNNAKVYDNAKVYNDAKVYRKAKVYGNVEVYDNAKVYGNAEVYDNAKVFGNANVYGYGTGTKVFGNARVSDNAIVFGNAKVYGNAKVFGKTNICDDARIHGNAMVLDNAIVSSNANIFGNSVVKSNVYVHGYARVFGNSLLSDDSNIYNNAIVKDSKVSGSSKIAENSIVENSEIDYSHISGHIYNAKIKNTIVLSTTSINGYKDIVPVIDDDRKFMTIGSINYTTEDGTNLTCLTAYYYDENIYYSFCIGKAHLCFKDEDELKDYLKNKLVYEIDNILQIAESLKNLLNQKRIKDNPNDK